MSQNPKKKKTNKARRRRRVAAFFLILFLIAGVVLSIALFFKISEIQVSGDLSRYSASSVVSASGIQKGDNLFLFNESRVEAQIWNAFPYIESVEVRRVLPGKVLIEIKEVSDLLCLAYNGQYIVMSSSLKVLEIVLSKPENIIEVVGLAPIDPSEGNLLQSENTDQLDFLSRLHAEIIRVEISDDIQQIDVTDKLNYSMILDNRFFVMIGTGHNVAYKMDMLKVTFEQNLYKTDRGYLDLSVAGSATFKPGDYLTDPGKAYIEPPDPDSEQEADPEAEEGG